MAEYLARLIVLATELLRFRAWSLPPANSPLWPVPHWPIFDFDATSAGAEWIDEIAARAKAIRDANAERIAIGHGDWSVKHFRFDGLRPTVIYDWDSLSADFEAVFVGGAARAFTYSAETMEPWPSLAEILAFFDEYQEARGEPFIPRGASRCARGSGLFTRLHGPLRALGRRGHGSLPAARAAAALLP